MLTCVLWMVCRGLWSRCVCPNVLNNLTKSDLNPSGIFSKSKKTWGILEPFWAADNARDAQGRPRPRKLSKVDLFGNPKNWKWHQNRLVEARSALGPSNGP